MLVRKPMHQRSMVSEGLERAGQRSHPCVGELREESQGLMVAFFGAGGDQELDLAHFAAMCKALHAELVRLEFLHYNHAGRVRARAGNLFLRQAPRWSTQHHRALFFSGWCLLRGLQRDMHAQPKAPSIVHPACLTGSA